LFSVLYVSVWLMMHVGRGEWSWRGRGQQKHNKKMMDGGKRAK